MTPAEFEALVVEVVNPVWPGELSAPERAAVWCRAHADIDVEVAAAAWERLTFTARGSWFPLPGEVRRAAVAVTAVLPPDDPGGLYSRALEVARSRPQANAHESMAARWHTRHNELVEQPWGGFALQVAERCDLAAVAVERSGVDARDRFVKVWRRERDRLHDQFLVPGGLRGVRLPHDATV